jgi:hypothetical protein
VFSLWCFIKVVELLNHKITIYSSCILGEFTAAGCLQRSAYKCSTAFGSDSTNFKFWDVYNGGSHVFSDVFQLSNISCSAYEAE